MDEKEIRNKIRYFDTAITKEGSSINQLNLILTEIKKLFNTDLNNYNIIQFPLERERYLKYFKVREQPVALPTLTNTINTINKYSFILYEYSYIPEILFLDYFFASSYGEAQMIYSLLFIKNSTQEKFANFVIDLVKRGHEEWADNFSKQQKTLKEKIFNRIFLPNHMIEDMLSNIDMFINNRKLYMEDLQIPWKIGFLFEGPPGNGKSLTIRSLQNYYDFECINIVDRIKPGGKIDLSDVIEYKSSELNCFELRNVESMLYPEFVKPKIFYIEDMEKQVSYCGENGQFEKTTISNLLNALDGIVKVNGVVFIGTTNNIESLSNAIIARPGRFEYIYTFPNPNKSEIKRFFDYYKLEIINGNINEFVEKLGGYSMNFVEEFIKLVKLAAKSNKISYKIAEDTFKRIKLHNDYSNKYANVGFRKEL